MKRKGTTRSWKSKSHFLAGSNMFAIFKGGESQLTDNYYDVQAWQELQNLGDENLEKQMGQGPFLRLG